MPSVFLTLWRPDGSPRLDGVAELHRHVQPLTQYALHLVLDLLLVLAVDLAERCLDRFAKLVACTVETVCSEQITACEDPQKFAWSYAELLCRLIRLPHAAAVAHETAPGRGYLQGPTGR